MPIVRNLLIPAILLWSLHTLAAEDIRFNQGQVTSTLRGEVTSTVKTYQFRARKGQRLAVMLAPAGGDKGTLTMTLYAYCGEEYGTPLVTDSINWQGPLPCTDRYTLDVAPSVDAMKSARAQRYALTVTIQ
jgi:hypothetical protein